MRLFSLVFLFIVVTVYLTYPSNNVIYKFVDFNMPPVKICAENIIDHDSLKIITNGSRKKKMIALTFDADMNQEMRTDLNRGNIKSYYNKEVIDLLRKYKIKATLFMTGMWTDVYPAESRELANDPLFEIENHSYSHLSFSQKKCFNLKAIARKEMLNDLKKSQAAILKNTGKKPNYFRFPGGCYDDFSLSTVNEFGLTPVQWDVSSGDAYLKEGEKIANRTLKKVKNGSIIVMHMNGGPHCPSTADALKILLPQLIKEKYEFVTLKELMN